MNALALSVSSVSSTAGASAPAFRASYLDSGFYVISDRAAGALVRANGKALPRLGWCLTVPLSIGGEAGTAELIRTPVRRPLRASVASRPGRSWRWALHAFRRETEAFPGSGVRAEFPALGRSFSLSPRSL